LVLAAIVAAGALCVLYGVFIERKWYRLVRYRLNILPAGADPLSLLHLSDLHYVRGDTRMRDFVASLPDPDLVVVTGDILGEPQAVEEAVAALRPVRGRLVSYFVLGSNDMYVPRPLFYFRYFRKRRRPVRLGTRGRGPELVEQLEQDGWIHLSNARHDPDGAPIEAGGLDDPHIHRPDLRAVDRWASSSTGKLGLAVVHSPDPAPELSALGYGLIVAGHTHGGQVRMPFVGALVNNCKLPTRMSRGMFRLGRSYLHVSPGLGTSKYAPFRFLCRPEAALIELGPSEH
jgi:predicted MPP superfamily phosphohydrolase